jgi:hypothetical protein
MTEVLKPPRQHLIVMIVATAIYGLALPFSVMAAAFSPMASDGGLNTGVWIIIIIITLVTAPLGIIAALILGWVFYTIRRPRAMFAAILMPLLWLLAFIVVPPWH